MIDCVVNPVAGMVGPDHKNVPPVLEGVAVIEADNPAQMVGLLTVIVGIGFTVTVDVTVSLLHPSKMYQES